MSVLLMFMMMGVIVSTGIGISVMHHEMHRSRLQSASDTAVLAATSSINTMEPEAVVTDYLSRAGYAETDIVAFNAETEYGGRSITIGTQHSIELMYSAFDNPTQVNVTSGATEATGKLEISLVLDTSGSMSDNNKIVELTAAAKSFYNVALTEERAPLTTVSVVPFASSVNVGATVFDALGGVRHVANNNCLDVSELDYTNTYLPGTGITQQSNLQYLFFFVFRVYGCGANLQEIMYLQNDPTVLNQHADNLVASGYTHTDAGMKYGLALLNSDSNFVLSTNGDDLGLPDVSLVRPDQANSDTKKVLVLMTDGQINPIHKSRAQAIADFELQCDLAREQGISVYTVAFDLGSLEPLEADTVEDQMKRCASTESHFFRAEDGELEDVFKTVALNLTLLRLSE